MNVPLRMTVEQFKKQSRTREGKAKGARKSKYGNDKVTVDGIEFDSKREAQRYGVLKLQERAGIITDLDLQKRIYLIGADGKPLRGESGRRLYYKADFVYLDDRNELVVEDSKGFKTPEYKLKKAILASMGYQIREV